MKELFTGLGVCILVLIAVLIDTSLLSLAGFPIFFLGTVFLVILLVNLLEKKEGVYGLVAAGVGGIITELFPHTPVFIELPGIAFFWFLFIAILIKYIIKEHVQFPKLKTS